MPLELRWETLEWLETQVRRQGQLLLASVHLGLYRLADAEVIRVGAPSLAEWRSWRYGTGLDAFRPRRGILERTLGALPPAPLEGYDPYGLTGPMSGVGGKHRPAEWLTSPFVAQARGLTAAFTSVPLARECPYCGGSMPICPWDFERISFHLNSDVLGVEAECAACRVRVPIALTDVRPALRMGLAILDSDQAARTVGAEAGTELERVGGARVFLAGLGRLRACLGELDRIDRVGLGVALDMEAEAEALDREWREAEELAQIIDGELTDVPGFRKFRDRVLKGSREEN